MRQFNNFVIPADWGRTDAEIARARRLAAVWPRWSPWLAGWLACGLMAFVAQVVGL